MTLEQVREGLDCISYGDITELKNLTNPPEGVKRVIFALCVLFGVPETWLDARKLLGDTRLITYMKNYDIDNIPM